ncbi:hypothetical protein [Thiothrix subterranea]|uniref:Uncharacterized protein n=1 Tax=Thiothrix subterranea TaxID=2735563 RepID=A0AA51MTA0_9GAMM|nr:hypothetical protein [Thiothrix subterranea]MDQ5767206.1 hypothetical protein [Thiothrix subterranea]WML87931.1 hypothetical protein RCG00_06065 [Thiothrix subterranea]
MDFFNNEAEVYQLQAFTIENRLDRVSLYGSLDITQDAQGLALALELKQWLDGMVMALNTAQASGNLPEKITINSGDQVENPFA